MGVCRGKKWLIPKEHWGLIGGTKTIDAKEQSRIESHSHGEEMFNTEGKSDVGRRGQLMPHKGRSTRGKETINTEE